MRKWTEHLKKGTNVRTLLDNRLLNTPCPSWVCTKGVVIAAWLKGWEWGHGTEESQEGLVISYLTDRDSSKGRLLSGWKTLKLY